MTESKVKIPLLLREKCGTDFEIEKIIGYQYSIGYTTEDWDFPIENYYCEKEENWSDNTLEKTEEWNELENLEDLSKWDKELIGRFCPKNRGYFEDFYKADNRQWPSLRWAYIYVYIANGNNLETIKYKEKDREAVIYGAFEGLRLWLEKRSKKTDIQHPDTSQEYRFLTKEDIDAKLSFLESLGDTTPIREELLAGIEDCYIWKEVWTRDTGHQWEEYTLLKRKPSEDEYDYADTWSFNPIQLGSFTTETIINMLKAYKK